MMEGKKPKMHKDENGGTVYDINIAANKILSSMPEGERGNSTLHAGYFIRLGSDGLHYLESAIDGHTVKIGGETDMGGTYIGEQDSRTDMIHWYRLTHPNTDMTDDEIAAQYGLK